MDAGFRAGFRDDKIIGEPAQTVPFAAVGPAGVENDRILCYFCCSLFQSLLSVSPRAVIS